MPSHIQLGKLGEQIASDFLAAKNLHIIDKNFRTKFGEIDIIIKQKDKLIFVEVKTRIGTRKGKPYEAVTKRKISHLKNAAKLYILQKKYKEYKLSLHVVSIILNEDKTVKKLDYFEDVFL